MNDEQQPTPKAGRASFRNQMGMGAATRTSCMTDVQKMQLVAEIEQSTESTVASFESKFAPSDMRQLALVAHNHMKPAMKEFIETYSEILKKFRITGTQTTMRMCKSLWGEDNPEIEYGLTCTSGPLGGDAQIAALMCMEDLGALIFFVDPLSAHPHQADIDSLIRLANCGNVIVCPNPTSAMSMLHTLKAALVKGDRGMIPSFFETLESPAVEEYKHQQELALAAAVAGRSPAAAMPALTSDPSMYFPARTSDVSDDIKEEEEEDDDDSDFDADEAMERISQLATPGIADSYHHTVGRRASGLSGVRLPEAAKKKKQKRIIKGIQQSMKRMNLI